MSIDDERDLAGRLDRAFAAITPPPAPLAGAIRRGKAIRLRRRFAAAASLAVAAAAAVAVPLLHAATSPPAGPPHPRHTVTVLPPGPHPAAGLIAAGTIDGRRWRITVSPPGTGGAPRDGLCMLALSLSSCGPASGARPSAPVDFGSMSDPYRQAQYGPVARDVSYVTVRLGDGTVLTLRPVTVYGVRYVGFAAPTAMTIRSATAYSARGVLATAIPFDQPGGAATFSLWLRPGQPGPARATHLIGAGTTAGRAWSVTGYAGPWGWCLAVRTGGTPVQDCLGTSGAMGTAQIGFSGGTPRVEYGSAGAPVSHVVIIFSNGMTVRARAEWVGNQKFFAFAVPPGMRAVRWQAFDSARQEIGWGRITGS